MGRGKIEKRKIISTLSIASVFLLLFEYELPKFPLALDIFFPANDFVIFVQYVSSYSFRIKEFYYVVD